MGLRTGKTKNLLQASIDAATLAVEVYNKPRTVFRSQNYISLMVMAWTYLFHAYFHHKIGHRYCYKLKNHRFEVVDGERKTWDLSTCMDKYEKLDKAIVANLKFFIGLRNKIEHRCVTDRTLDTSIFGECQALLYNYETMLVNLFGEKYVINENLAYSLQFSTNRAKEQEKANRRALLAELKEVKQYIENYRTNLSAEVFNSQDYSVKLIQIPKVSNTNRNDLAIEFVNWNQLNPEDKERYDRLTTIIKEKVVQNQVLNMKRLKPMEVIKKVEEKTGISLGTYYHMQLYVTFGIRHKRGSEKETDTKTDYCLYDHTHKDFIYEEKWPDFLISAFNNGKLNFDIFTKAYEEGRFLRVEDYLN
jgi:hypothetical protein